MSLLKASTFHLSGNNRLKRLRTKIKTKMGRKNAKNQRLSRCGHLTLRRLSKMKLKLRS